MVASLFISDVETYFMPWLMDNVADKLEQAALVGKIADGKDLELYLELLSKA